MANQPRARLADAIALTLTLALLSISAFAAFEKVPPSVLLFGASAVILFLSVAAFVGCVAFFWRSREWPLLSLPAAIAFVFRARRAAPSSKTDVRRIAALVFALMAISAIMIGAVNHAFMNRATSYHHAQMTCLVAIPTLLGMLAIFLAAGALAGSGTDPDTTRSVRTDALAAIALAIVASTVAAVRRAVEAVFTVILDDPSGRRRAIRPRLLGRRGSRSSTRPRPRGFPRRRSNGSCDSTLAASNFAGRAIIPSLMQARSISRLRSKHSVVPRRSAR